MDSSVIFISSDDENVEEEESGSEFSPSSENDDDDSESDNLDYDEDDEDDVECESDGEKRPDNERLDDDELCDRVVCLLHQGRHDAEELKHMCKAYLRKHGLRLSGTKEECVQRIKEHWRLKNGRAEALYPRSSFCIDCTGDVCKGDDVLFKQRVYEKFDKVTRKGRMLGKRTVAGRIIRESYGAAKQQHTFTVEVFWSKGFKKLPLLSILLVKGRNLYRFKTFRQRWNNEAERLKVLAEKHKRGSAARLVRAMNKTVRTSNTDRGNKRQKLCHQGPSQMKQLLHKDEAKSAKRRGVAPGRSVGTNGRKRKAQHVENMESTQPHQGPPQRKRRLHKHKRKSTKREGTAPGKNVDTKNHKRKVIHVEKVESTRPHRGRQLTLHSNPSQYFHDPSREYRAHRSSFPIPYNRVSSLLMQCAPPNPNPPSLPGYTHYSYERREPHPLQYGLPSYTRYNYEQRVPRNYPISQNTYRPTHPVDQNAELYRRPGYRC